MLTINVIIFLDQPDKAQIPEKVDNQNDESNTPTNEINTKEEGSGVGK